MEIDRIRWDKFSDLLFDRRWKWVSVKGTRERLSQCGVISFIREGGMCTQLGRKKNPGRGTIDSLFKRPLTLHTLLSIDTLLQSKPPRIKAP